jgi:hypothetical protein
MTRVEDHQLVIHLFNGVYQLTDYMMTKWWDDYERAKFKRELVMAYFYFYLTA